MNLDEVKRQFVEQVKLRAYDDKYIDKNEEREILQIAIQLGVSIDSARMALLQVCDEHEYVVESAVVGLPDERWGEVPVAFVALREDVDAGALADYARERLARYKVPRRFEFCAVPKTSTGKIQKNVLRDRAHELYGST